MQVSCRQDVTRTFDLHVSLYCACEGNIIELSDKALNTITSKIPCCLCYSKGITKCTSTSEHSWPAHDSFRKQIEQAVLSGGKQHTVERLLCFAVECPSGNRNNTLTGFHFIMVRATVADRAASCSVA